MTRKIRKNPKTGVLEALRKLPKGKVATYKSLARRFRLSPRQVGRILNSNKCTKKYPCYKVVMSSGKIGGCNNGISRKIELLKKDGIDVKRGRIAIKKYIFQPKRGKL